MEDTEFVEALRVAVLGAGSRTVEHELRLPEAAIESHLKPVMKWARSLDESERTLLNVFIRHSILRGLFHTLVVLDNCDAIELADEGEELGEFRLEFVKNGVARRLGDPPEFLHDLLNSSIQFPEPLPS